MSSHRMIAEFVLEQSTNLPAVRRIQILRALADIVGDPNEAKKIEKLADDLSAFEFSAREFQFQFQQTNLKKTNQ